MCYDSENANRNEEAPMTVIEKQQFDEERALYNLTGANVIDCVFAGPADGESVLKEARDVTVENCSFSLRYPLWHVEGFKLLDSRMDEKTRAAIWYARNGKISESDLMGIKAVRECQNIVVDNSNIDSAEFGWKCENIHLSNTTIRSEYLFLDSKHVTLDQVQMQGKYSFQYVKNVTMESCTLDTKDAFWHAEDVTLRNCTVKGEYLAWYSKRLTMIDCKISGTQPFCYCEGLKLINCEMHECDLAFEKSSVEATVTTHIDSIKNPSSGYIEAPSAGEIILHYETECAIRVPALNTK